MRSARGSPAPPGRSASSRRSRVVSVVPGGGVAREPGPMHAGRCPPLSRGRQGWGANTRDRVSTVEHGPGGEGRAGAAAPLERQPDEAKLALADQRLEVAQAFHMRDVELEA